MAAHYSNWHIRVLVYAFVGLSKHLYSKDLSEEGDTSG